MVSKKMNEAIELFSQYEGKIVQEENRVKIIAINEIGAYGGKVRKVECQVEIHRNIGCTYPYGISADEKTLQILGGMASPSDDLEEALIEAKKQLNRYNFRHKKEEQLTLL